MQRSKGQVPGSRKFLACGREARVGDLVGHSAASRGACYLSPVPNAHEGISRRGLWLGGAAAAACGALASVRPRIARADDERVLEEATSEFNKIQVTERGSVRTMYFLVDGRRYIESRWDTAHPSSLDLDYARTMMGGFLVHPSPRRVMMMGLGGGQLANFLFERFPGVEIDAVDIDPEVVRLAHKWFGVPADPRYRTHVGDGRLFLEKAKTPWDVVILDAFRGVFVPYHLKTIEAYRAVANALTEDGVVVANLHNQTRHYANDRRTLAEVFPYRYPFLAEAGNQTSFVGAKRGPFVGVYGLRRNARLLANKFDFDLMGLAARLMIAPDYDPKAEILRDDFEPSELDEAAGRHNQISDDGRYKYEMRRR